MPETGSFWVPVFTGALLEPGLQASSGDLRPQELLGQKELVGAGVSWESAFMGACHEHGAREVSWCHGGLGPGVSIAAWDYGSLQLAQWPGDLSSHKCSKSLELRKLPRAVKSPVATSHVGLLELASPWWVGSLSFQGPSENLNLRQLPGTAGPS